MKTLRALLQAGSVSVDFAPKGLLDRDSVSSPDTTTLQPQALGGSRGQIEAFQKTSLERKFGRVQEGFSFG